MKNYDVMYQCANGACTGFASATGMHDNSYPLITNEVVEESDEEEEKEESVYTQVD